MLNQFINTQTAHSPNESLLVKRGHLLSSFEMQNSKFHKLSSETPKKNFLSDYLEDMSGNQFFWYQDEDIYDKGFESTISSGEESENEKECLEANVSRITTNEQHISLLKSVVKGTNNYVQIASYGISMDILDQIKDDIAELQSKGVGIHFYNSDQKPCSTDVLNFIQQNKICYQQIQMHSKFLFSDGQIAAIGSFNWLSSDAARYSNGKNATLVISGDQICRGLSSQISVFIRQYIYKKQKKFDSIASFRRIGTTNMPVYFDLNDGSKLTYVPTLEAHRKFLDAAFEMAKNSLTLCCPFVNESSEFLIDLSPRRLVKTANRGVKVRIICKNLDIEKFRRIYSKILTHRNICFIPAGNDLHQKTLVVDEHLIAEGSFNWMSASRDEESYYHKNELTLVYEGGKAKPLIDAFNQSLNLQTKSELNDNNKSRSVNLRR